MAIVRSSLRLSNLSVTFSFRSRLLSSSIAVPPQNTPLQSTVITEFLLNDCGFCPSLVSRIMKRRPSLWNTRSAHAAQKVVRLLRDSGFTENQLERTIFNIPTILSRKADGELKAKIDFLKTLGFTHLDLGNTISMAPRCLNFNLDNNLIPRISDLEKLFGSKANLLNALKRAPRLMVADMEKQLKPKMEYVKNMGIPEGSKSFATYLNFILGKGFENMEMKLKQLASFGFVEKEIHQMVKNNPAIFSQSTIKLQNNMDFLIHTAGFTLTIVVSYPVLLNYSLEKRLKPRHEVFKALNSMHRFKQAPSLVQMFRVEVGECYLTVNLWRGGNILSMARIPRNSNQGSVPAY